jgi:hypothetical protein
MATVEERVDPLKIATEIAGGIYRGDPVTTDVSLDDSINEAQLYALVSIAQSLQGIERALNRPQRGRGIGGPW